MIKKKEVMDKLLNNEEEFVKWFSEINNKDISTVGGKGASLGEMYNNKFPVPVGFVITAQAFEYFINQLDLKERISEIIQSLDFEETEELQKASRIIRDLIEEKEIPKSLKEEILEAYHILGSEKIETRGISQDALNILKNSQEPAFVSVRSSATTEDLVGASFAGQQESFLNVKGDSKLIEYVKKCFSSLYTARAIFYRNKQGFKEGDSLLAVVIQKMVDSEKSGVIFSRDPVNLSEDVVIEAVFGLGEGIVSGKIKPDYYSISRDLKIKEVKVEIKNIAIVKNSGGENTTVKLSSEKSKTRVLTNGEILELTDLAIKLEEHYEKPQDIEFAIEGKKIYIVQSRPITTLEKRTKGKIIQGKIILEGLGASPGIGVGVVKIIETMKDLPKIKKGDVLVTKMTNPDMVVSMQKSVAIITDEGGMTSHASIVSREMGIPAIVGTVNATSVLKEGMKVTVDGSYGKVYEGEVAETQQAEIKPAVKVNKIKLKLIVDLPEFAERAAKSEIDSIGLTRIEGIIASMNKHPLKYEKDNILGDYTELLRKSIEKISKPFKSVWIRASDIRTDEYSSLEGAPEREINPMLGFHGARFLLKHPKILQAELLAIKKVAEEHSDKRFGIMFPQIILLSEIRELKKYFDEIKTKNMEFGVMIETPAAVQIIEEICLEEIEFISFGTNDLTQFTLAVDRGEEEVQYLYDELNPAVLSQIKKVIEICKRNKVQTSLCGQAGSNPKMVEFLFKTGIDSISLNADAAFDISSLIKKMESEIKPESSQPINVQTNDLAEKTYEDKNPRSVICADCGNETKLPFKPNKNKKYYCKSCFKNHKGIITPSSSNSEVQELSKFNYSNKNMPASMKDIKEQENKPQENKQQENRFLNADNIKFSAELQGEEEAKYTGPIEPIGNLNRIDERSEEIHNKIEKDNLERAKEYDEIEDSIEVSGGAVDEER
jgi:pyruvate,water dikinase